MLALHCEVMLVSSSGTSHQATEISSRCQGKSPSSSVAWSICSSRDVICAEDIFEELDKYGEIENLNICDNLADHMVGSVYAKFKDENDAARAMQVKIISQLHCIPIISVPQLPRVLHFECLIFQQCSLS